MMFNGSFCGHSFPWETFLNGIETDIMSENYREIPYNYTSLSDKEIILKYLDKETWSNLDTLRGHRVTGRSAKLLFEIYGDIFIIDRNPYIANDFLEKPAKLNALKKLHKRRLKTIEAATTNEHGEMEVFRKTKALVRDFFKRLEGILAMRRKILLQLSFVTDRGNIKFDGFHRVSHCTDATDWRIEYPDVVVYPDNADEVRRLVRAAEKLHLKVIARGGGTGLTGGAVPVSLGTMVINTEKLCHIGPIEIIREGEREIPTVALEAGAVTEQAMEACRHAGYVFATDPTSAWASTIGGNIAENAGGKKCVMWGTCIDNLHSFDMVIAGGRVLRTVRRNHPYRKIKPDDLVIFDVFTLDKNGTETLLRTVELKGTEIRKPGLGKDITNKALNGLPGIQKEGGDGIIVRSRFVVYKPFAYAKTICLEFFGASMADAAKAIVAIQDKMEKNKEVFLTALEHMDDKYLDAVRYINKSDRGELLKAILLIDVESDDRVLLDRACGEIEAEVRPFNTEAFTASTSEERELFWKDRKNLGAIARHTNAFKINEDVVIPLDKLPEFTDFIDRMNQKKELQNSLASVERVGSFFQTNASSLTNRLGEQRFSKMVQLISKDAERYTLLLQRLSAPRENGRAFDSEKVLFEQMQDGLVSLDFENEVKEKVLRSVRDLDDLSLEITKIIEAERKRKIIIATHMHAGDGNSHVNIPVHSNDYAMLKEAEETAEAVMRETIRLGGVVSGEHGIGITKLKFLEPVFIQEYARYKAEADPLDLFNPGKLRADFPYERVYTPSFNLLELEAFILTATDLKSLSESISGCVRCGKCKAVCNTHYPEGTMPFNPRNKILGVGLIIEAVLYDTLTSNRLSFRNFRKLTEISNHCTMCHKCETPCPVKIDFGRVTLGIRELLVSRKKTTFKPAPALAYFFLGLKGYRLNRVFRFAIFNAGYGAQRLLHAMTRPIHRILKKHGSQIGRLLDGRFPRAGRPTLRDLLGLKDRRTLYAFSNPKKEIQKTVFYFPGCGSERMFSEISIATLALFHHAGIRVVIPPEYTCCGYPAVAAGKQAKADIIGSSNQVLFHKAAGLLGYMKIDSIVVTCGTCMEMLEKTGLSGIFGGAPVVDANEFIVQNNLLPSLKEAPILYHDPCHSPLKRRGAAAVIECLIGAAPVSVPRCCGEGGTLALATPQIAGVLRDRKEKNIQAAMDASQVEVITTCPSCVQGLSKIHGKISVTGKSLVVYLAEKHLGRRWRQDFIKSLRSVQGSVDRTLF
jgi:FAD/FMN-containing dehydrogenase/Fe-S oxidoreductase